MPAFHPVVNELSVIVGPDGVLGDPDELYVYECDGFPIARGLPTAVVFPRDTQQVAACVAAIAKHDLQVVARGAGTGLAGGAVAYGEGVIVCTSRMTTIESIDLESRVACVQAGVCNTALTDAVASQGGVGPLLHFSPDPSSQRASTIGGNAATNAGGITTLKHGVTTNHILAVEIVLADGTIATTRAPGLADAAGPDLTGLICGSEGTLGIITRLWCRLVPKPRCFRTIYATFTSTASACRSVSDVIAAGIVPASMEMMDGSMVKVVEDAFHYGFDASAAALLLIEIDGVDLILDEQLEAIRRIIEHNGGGGIEQCADPQRRAALWSARKRAFGAIGRISPSYCTQDACIPRSKLPEAVERLVEIGAAYGLKITNVFHAGDGNVHPILLFDDADPDQVQNTLRCADAMLEYCISLGGAITGEHGVGVEKLHLMPRMFNPQTIALFQEIKNCFDPHHRLNDGKLIPSDTLRIEILKPMATGNPGGASSG